MTGWMFVASLALAAQTGAAPSGQTVAVLPLGGTAPEAVRVELEGLVRAEVGRLVTHGTVLDADATREQVATAEMMGLTCLPDDTPCVARMAIVMQVDRVLAGKVALVGDAAKLSLFWVEGASGVRLNEVEQVVPTSGPARLSVARDVVTLLVAPEQVLGSLRLAVQPAGALIVLDGEPVGTAPMTAPLTGVRAGRHAVRVELDGYASHSEPIEVNPGQETLVEVALSSAGVASLDPPDEELGLVDDAPAAGTGGEGTLGVPVLIAGGVAAALGGGAFLGAAGAALAIDQLLWNTDVGGHEQRNQLWLIEAALAAGATMAGGVLLVGLAATATGGVLLAVE